MKINLTLILFAFISGSSLAVPVFTADGELSAVTELSDFELEARVIYEMSKGNDANLENLLMIEQDLMFSTTSERSFDLLSRVVEAKYLALARKADGPVASNKAESKATQKKWLIASGQAEADPPELIAISVDRVSVDVSEGPQTVTFTVEATDATGVDWSAVPETRVVLRNQNGKFYSAWGDNSSPGIFTLTLESTDPTGVLGMQWLTIVDTLGNEKVYRYSESLKPLGPTCIDRDNRGG